MTLGVSPSSITSSNVTGTNFAAAGPVTATPSGGRSPYSYQWSIVSSDGHTFTIDSPNNASTTVSFDGTVISGHSAACQIQCVANDSTGLSATSQSVPVSFQNNGGVNNQGGGESNPVNP